MSLVNPTVTLLANAESVSERASTWASGRKISRRCPSASSVGRHSLAPRVSYSRLEWVSWQPLGRPVVPEV